VRDLLVCVKVRVPDTVADEEVTAFMDDAIADACDCDQENSEQGTRDWVIGNAEVAQPVELGS
jgi:hypothetical protein